jgi:hypothetical protein
LFTLLFGSENPDTKTIQDKLNIILDLTRQTVDPLKSCLFSDNRLQDDVEKYIFKEEKSNLMMLVNVINGTGMHNEKIKIAEHIYIHRSPSSFIKKWLIKLKSNLVKEPPLAKLLHEYAISIIKPQYIVSHPLKVMDPIFTELRDEGILEEIPKNSYEFEKIKENLPFAFRVKSKTCEDIKVMFKVIPFSSFLLSIPPIRSLTTSFPSSSSSKDNSFRSLNHLLPQSLQSIGSFSFKSRKVSRKSRNVSCKSRKVSRKSRKVSRNYKKSRS